MAPLKRVFFFIFLLWITGAVLAARKYRENSKQGNSAVLLFLGTLAGEN